jgi:hypothetical protein
MNKKIQTIQLPKQVHRNLVHDVSFGKYPAKTFVERKDKEKNFRKEKYRKNFLKNA